MLINPSDGEDGGGRETSQMDDAVGVLPVCDVLEFPHRISAFGS